MDILYIDNHLLILNKPAGLLVQPSSLEEHSLELLGKEWIKKKFNKQGNIFLHALHRIDRPVSGIVLFARTSKALSRLNEQQRMGRFQKEYLAIVEGSVKPASGVLEHFLKRSPYSTIPYLDAQEGTKKSLLEFTVLKRIKEKTYLKIILLTGRYHQIRAQCAAIGHPIVGDSKYGSQFHSKAIFLHHRHLRFPHPITQQLIDIHAPIPQKWG